MSSCRAFALCLAASWMDRAAACDTWGWHDAYGGERCWNEGNKMNIKCEDKGSGSNCGGRIMHSDQFGVGDVAMRIKAAPGCGVVTSFYLSNNGGMFVEGGSWNEIDFEIMGCQAKDGGTRIWTNYFTGQGEEHHGFWSVPFDVSADEHLYTIRVNLTHVQWLVDERPLRTSDFSAYQDMVDAVKGNTFQSFASVWGKAWSDPPLGAVQEFTDGMGKLDDNFNGFPIVASFQPGAGKPPGTIANLTAYGEESDEEVEVGEGKAPGTIANLTAHGEESDEEGLIPVKISDVEDKSQQVGFLHDDGVSDFARVTTALGAATAVSTMLAIAAVWHRRSSPASVATEEEPLTEAMEASREAGFEDMRSI